MSNRDADAAEVDAAAWGSPVQYEYDLLLLLPVILLLGMAATPWVAARGILRPVYVAGRGSSAPTRYSVSDLICLTFYLSLAAAAVNLARFEIVSRGAELALMGIAALFVAATWWMGVGLLCRAEIANPLRRSVFLCVAVPLAYAGVAASGPATLLVALTIGGWSEARATVGSLPVALAAWLLLIAGFVLARQVAVWACDYPASRGGSVGHK